MGAMMRESDETFLNDVFDLAVRFHATGEAFDVDALLVGRTHLREQLRQTLELARDVAVAQSPHSQPALAPRIRGFSGLEEIGRGGVGIVYRATQESLNRTVAVKVLAPSLALSKRARERFVAEAHAHGRVRHPNVVAVYDIVADGDICAYAMEWVDGQSLARRLEDHQLDFATVARIGAQMARALDAVHDAGLIHRDVKPGNILIRADGVPLLSDFGLVRDAEHRLHTTTGEFIGTLAFAAPEQIRGEQTRIGPRSDVYGLGVTIYTALAGRTPFGASTTAETLRLIESQSPRPLSQFRSGVPPDLMCIIAKAMDRSPDRRYATAAALADDLERFLRFEPILGRPSRLPERARRWMRGHVGTLAIACVLAGAAATAVALWPSDARPVRTEPATARYTSRLALAQVALAGDDGYGAAAILETIPPELRGWEWGHLRSKTDSSRLLGMHDGEITALAMGFDGTRVASGSADGTARIWDLVGGKETLRVKHESPVSAVALSLDGRTLITASKSVALWDSDSGVIRRRFATSIEWTAMACDPSGTRLAAGDAQGMLRLFDVETLRGSDTGVAELPTPRWEVSTGRLAVAAIEFGGSGAWVAAGSGSGFCACDVAKGTVSRRFDGALDIAAHPTRDEVVASSYDSVLMNVKTGARLADFRGHRDRILAAAWTSSGNWFVAGAGDRTLRVWDETGDSIATRLGHAGNVNFVVVAPRTNLVVSASATERAIRVWDLTASDFAVSRISLGRKARHLPVRFATDAKMRFVAISADFRGYSAGVWALDSADEAQGLEFPERGGVHVAVSRDGTRCVSSGSAGIDVFDGDALARAISEGASAAPPALTRIAVVGRRAPLISFGRGHELFVATDDGRVVRHDLDGARGPTVIAAGEDRFVSLDVDPDGGTIAIGLTTGVSLWDVEDRREIRRFNGPECAAVAFSPDGRFLASVGGAGNQLVLWDRAAQRRHAVLSGHDDAVTSLAFSPDGRRLASGSLDRTVRIWDPHSAELVITLRDHPYTVSSVGWTADGTRLISGGGDGRLAVRRAWRR